MKYLNIQLFFILLLLSTACSKSGSSSPTNSPSNGDGSTVSKIQPAVVLDETAPLYKCYKGWSELKDQIMENKTIQEEQASQWALGFTASDCLKVSDLKVLKKVYDVYSKVNPADVKATDWSKAIADVNLDGKS